VSSVAALPLPKGIYLASYLAPFAEALGRPDVTDIYVNRPGELWVETLNGAVERHDSPGLDETTLARLSHQLAALTHQGVSREHPLLAATLPDGYRIQIVAPPATRGPLALAIRKQVVTSLTLHDYASDGQFTSTQTKNGRRGDAAIERLVADRKFAEALSLAVRTRKNIVVSGGTSTGKTTFLNALLREVVKPGLQPMTLCPPRSECARTASSWASCAVRRLSRSCAPSIRVTQVR